MSIVSFRRGSGDESEGREPTAAELAAIEGVELSYGDRRQVWAYWDRVIRECYPSRPARCAELSVAAEPTVAPVAAGGQGDPAWLAVEDAVAELDAEITRLVSAGRVSELDRRRVRREERRVLTARRFLVAGTDAAGVA